MSERLKAAMLEATRLTQEGRLAEAAQVIRQALHPSGSGATRPGPPAKTSERADLAGGMDEGGSSRGASASSASFSAGRFSNVAGARDFKLFRPSGIREATAPKARGLLVMLHGCAQDPDDCALGTRLNEHAEAARLLVLYPAQTGAVNASRCWSWYDPGSQVRGQGEPAIIAGMTAEVIERFGISSSRVFVAGFSAGGAMTACLVATYPELFAAAAIHSGLPYGAATDVVSAMAAMSQGQSGQVDALPKDHRRAIPVIVFQGDADTTVHPSHAHRIIDQFLGDGAHRARLRIRSHHSDQPEGPGSGKLGYSLRRYTGADGEPLGELWLVQGARHGWLGGDPRGTFTEPRGPDATREMLRFFLSLDPA